MMNETNNDAISELEKATDDEYKSLSTLKEGSSPKNIINAIGKENSLIIINTAKDLYHKVISKEDAISRVRRSISEVSLTGKSTRGAFIYKKLQHRHTIVKDEIKSCEDKLKDINEHNEIEVSPENRNKIPWEYKDKVIFLLLIVFITIVFILEVFTSGETLIANFLLFAANTAWAFSLGVLFGLGGIGIKLWGLEHSDAMHKKINNISLFILFLGLMVFIISIIFSQLNTSNYNTEIILDTSQELPSSKISWISFVLLGFSLISFGLLQILTGILVSKWKMHGHPLSTIYEINPKYNHLNNKLAKLKGIQYKIEDTIQLYFQIIENEENRTRKVDVTAESVLFSQVRKLKIAAEKLREADKL